MTVEREREFLSERGSEGVESEGGRGCRTVRRGENVKEKEEIREK